MLQFYTFFWSINEVHAYSEQEEVTMLELDLGTNCLPVFLFLNYTFLIHVK